MLRLLSAILLVLLFSAGLASADTFPPTPSSTSVADQSMPSASAVLSQNDARWDWKRMGNTTLGRGGCLIMNLVQMGLDKGYGSDPSELLEKILTSGMIRRNGDFQTHLIDVIFPGLRILERPFIHSNSELSGVLPDKLAEGTVLLKLLRGYRHHRPDFHWVRAIAVENGEVEITDPAGGRIGILSTLYRQARVQELMVVASK